MDGVVVREPTIELLNHRGGVRTLLDLCIVALEGLHEGSAIPFNCGLSIGVVRGTRPITLASTRVSAAV